MACLPSCLKIGFGIVDGFWYSIVVEHVASARSVGWISFAVAGFFSFFFFFFFFFFFLSSSSSSSLLELDSAGLGFCAP